MTDQSISLWDSSAEEQNYTGAFVEHSSVDVAIIGGGFTGLSTALHCGITTGTLFGKAMADLLTGLDPSELPLPVSKMEIAKSAPIMSTLNQTAFTMNQVVKSI